MVRGFEGTNFKKDIPKKTVVVDVPEADVDIIVTLIRAYSDDMPPKLSNLLDDFVKKLEG